MAGARWTQAEDADMRELYATTKNSVLAGILNERHGNGRSAQSVNLRARKLGLRKADGYKRIVPPTFWNDERREWFVSFVPGHSESEIGAEHERLFGTPLTEGQIGNAKTKFGVKSGTHGGRFVKGQRSWNKGKRQAEFMSAEAIERTKATRFRKGNMPHNAQGKPIGFERVDSKDGYVWVKVAERPSRQDCNDNWRPKHHIVWEEAHGEPVPDDAQIVFANHDKRDFRPENIVAVPHRLWAIVVRDGGEYHDAESLQACVTLAELRHRIRAVELSPRECRKCGREFAPRYPNQKTCDGCLGRHGGTRPLGIVAEEATEGGE